MAPLSTAEVAARVGVHRATLEEWLSAGKVKQPKRIQIGGKSYRLWTESDIERVKSFKANSYRKGRGRRKRTITTD